MTAIIDTSSLVALVRYYLPFDKDDSIKNFLRQKFEKKELIIIDKVVEEASYIAKGLVIKKLDFLASNSYQYKHITKTDTILPSSKFIRDLDNDFCNKEVLRLKAISPEQYALEKQNYLEGTDAKLILYTQNYLGSGLLAMMGGATIVTEETATGNDGKIFKKIPAICKLTNLDCCTLPELFENHFKIKLSEFCH
jgi:hypothetical protein